MFIPRAQNHLANELAFTAINCQIPQTDEKFIIKVKTRPAVLDNDKHIEDFPQSKNEFSTKSPSSAMKKNV